MIGHTIDFDDLGCTVISLLTVAVKFAKYTLSPHGHVVCRKGLAGWLVCDGEHTLCDKSTLIQGCLRRVDG